MKRITFILIILLFAFVACNKSRESGVPSMPGATGKARSAASPASASTSDESTKPEDKKLIVSQQKIIKTAEVVIESTNLDSDLRGIENKVTGFEGYVARSTDDRQTETIRSAHLEIKVPAGHFNDLLNFLQKDFKLEKLSTNSQDVTEDYFDIDARLKNAKNEENRLLFLLENKTGKLEEVLTVERELARVRETIEIYEGKLRFFDNRVSLSTVAIDLHQERPFAAKKSWLSQIGRESKETFKDSIDLLGRSIRAIILFFAVALPWLIVAVIVYGLIRLIRRKRKR